MNIKKAPWPVVFTTADASLGHDLLKLAHIIQTELPYYWSKLVQGFGRGNRIDPNAILYGTLITTADVHDYESVKAGCEYNQSQEKFFHSEYSVSVRALELCSRVNENLVAFDKAVELFK